jgi:hypothetical protein
MQKRVRTFQGREIILNNQFVRDYIEEMVIKIAGFGISIGALIIGIRATLISYYEGIATDAVLESTKQTFQQAGLSTTVIQNTQIAIKVFDLKEALVNTLPYVAVGVPLLVAFIIWLSSLGNEG